MLSIGKPFTAFSPVNRPIRHQNVHCLLIIVLFLALLIPCKQVQAQPFIGEIKQVAFNFAPRNWALCDGQILPIASYTALFSLLGTTYGGDGRVTFALPDMRGRFSNHAGQGPGLNRYVLGQRGGAETTTLTVNQMPGHTHGFVVSDAFATSVSPTGMYMAKDVQGVPQYGAGNLWNMNAGVIQNQGGSQSHENRPPFLTLNWIICLAGEYPSRP